jgi:hypothetical protein
VLQTQIFESARPCPHISCRYCMTDDMCDYNGIIIHVAATIVINTFAQDPFSVDNYYILSVLEHI